MKILNPETIRILQESNQIGLWGCEQDDNKVELYLRKLNLWGLFREDESRLIIQGFDRELNRMIVVRKFDAEGDSGYSLIWFKFGMIDGGEKWKAINSLVEIAFVCKVDKDHPILWGKAPPQQKFS